MKIKIIADSSANLHKLSGQVPFSSVPLKISTDEREFVDDETLDPLEMANYMKGYKGKSGSACPGVQDWLDAFADADAVFCFTITSNLSGAYNSARVAKEDYEGEYPERKVYLIDSLSTGPEIKVLIERTQKLIEEGKEPEVIYQDILEYKEHTKLIFCLESMQNLANNGRVSHAVAKIAGILGIRAYGCASAEGTLEMMGKARGEKKAIVAIKDAMKGMKYNGGRVIIDHCDNMSAAVSVKELILRDYPEANVSIESTHGLCTFYAELGGLLVGFEIE